MRQIEITTSDKSVKAEIFETITGNKIYNSLPIEGTANVWGEEIYFNIGFLIEQEPEAKMEVEVGELGYWPVGTAFCIFFGPTPVSENDKPKAYSPINVFGKIIGNATIFKSVKQGEKVKISRA